MQPVRAVPPTPQPDPAPAGFAASKPWLALGLGLTLLLVARRRSPAVRSLAATAATGLIARAAAGRNGLWRLVR